MTLPLVDILALVGRLDDAPGYDSARERFRRYLSTHVTDVAALRALLAQTQERLGDQHARARHDVVTLLGRFLGLEVIFGAYQPTARGSGQPDSEWRSASRAHILLAVLSEQSTDEELDHLSRVVTERRAGGAAGERWVGLCVTTPFYTARRHLEERLIQRTFADLRCVSLDSVLWLADSAAASRLPHDDVVRLLTSGPDSDFMIGLMRRLTEPSGSEPAREPADPPDVLRADGVRPDTPASDPLAPVVERRAASSQGAAAGSAGGTHAFVAPPQPAVAPSFWLATIGDDESATPEQILYSVIGRRHVLGIGDAAPIRLRPRAGDGVCFAIPGTGVVGCAHIDSVITDATPPIRSARRFSAVFRLREVVLFDTPSAPASDAVLRQATATLQPGSGSVLFGLSRADYEWLTAGSSVERALGS